MKRKFLFENFFFVLNVILEISLNKMFWGLLLGVNQFNIFCRKKLHNFDPIDTKQ